MFFVGPSGPCATAPCQNGGKCVDIGNGTYRCQCPSSHRGTNCETGTNRCKLHFCVIFFKTCVHKN